MSMIHDYFDMKHKSATTEITKTFTRYYDYTIQNEID